MTDEIAKYYEIKLNAKDITHPDDSLRIRSRIKQFAKDQGGLEIAVGGNYVKHDPTPESYPYGNPNGTTYDSKMDIYHVHGCTIKVYGDVIRRSNYGDEFIVLLFGEKDRVQKISEELDCALDQLKN